MSEREDVRFIQGDALAVLKTLPSESVHCTVTSPPYYSLRCYGVEGQIGLEETPDCHIERLVEVFREVKRVLRSDGVCFVNYGDCYTQGMGFARGQAYQRHAPVKSGMWEGTRLKKRDMGNEGQVKSCPGLKPKDLVGMPFRLALALQADGWWWRSCLPWLKRSAMPESCTDRPSTALEYVLLFAKSERYFWDGDAVRRPASSADRPQPRPGDKRVRPNDTPWHDNRYAPGPSGFGVDPSGRNLRNSDFYFDSLDLAIEQAKAELAHLTHLRERGGLLLSEEGEPLALDVNTEASKEAHFASFPRKLVQPLVQAGTSERGCCAECGAPWIRVVDKEYLSKAEYKRGGNSLETGTTGAITRMGDGTRIQTLGWRKSCRCETEEVTPAVVLDPFAGTGTTLLVANNLGRRAIGIDLKDDYLAMARRRNAQVSLLL